MFKRKSKGKSEEQSYSARYSISINVAGVGTSFKRGGPMFGSTRNLLLTIETNNQYKDSIDIAASAVNGILQYLVDNKVVKFYEDTSCENLKKP